MALGDIFSGAVSSVGGFFKSTAQSVGGFFSKTPTAPTTVQAVTKAQTVSRPTGSVPLPASKPAYTPAGVPTSTVSTIPTQGLTLNNALSFLDKVTGIAQQGVTTYFGAKSQIEQLQAAQKLEETKLKAIVASAQSAPPAAQIMLPSVTDWLTNPREAASMVTPAALAGSGIVQSGISSIAIIGGIGVIAYFLIKKAG